MASISARLARSLSRSVARGLRLLVSQLLFDCGAAASPRDVAVPAAPGGLLPQPATRHVNNTLELIDAVEDASVGTIVVAAGTYSLTGAMSGAACGQYDGPSALCIGRSLTIRAETNGTVVLDAMKQDRRVVYVASGGRAELIGLNITGGKTDYVHPAVEPSIETLLPSPRWSARFLSSADHLPFWVRRTYM